MGRGTQGLGFDAAREDLDVAEGLGAWQEAGDSRLWKTIVSPEQAARLDLRAHARALVAAMERDLGTRLEWVGIDHHNTDHPHLHLLIRGRDDHGRPLTLEAPYVQRGIRTRSEELATRRLGLRTGRDIAASRAQAVGRAQVTELDRSILARAAGDRQVAYGDRPSARQAERAQRRLEMQRLDFLATLGLVERVGPGTWQLSPQLEPTLQQIQLTGDIQKSHGRHRAPLSDARIPLVVTPLTPGLRLEGRVVGSGMADAERQRRYLLLEGTDRRLHYVLHPPGSARAWDGGRLRVGDRVALEGRSIHREGRPRGDAQVRGEPGKPGSMERPGGEASPLPTLATLQREQSRPIRVVPPLDGLIYRGQLLGYARDSQGRCYAVVDTGRELSAFRTEERGLVAGREVVATGRAVGDGRQPPQRWDLRGAELQREQGRAR